MPWDLGPLVCAILSALETPLLRRSKNYVSGVPLTRQSAPVREIPDMVGMSMGRHNNFRRAEVPSHSAPQSARTRPSIKKQLRWV
jgi:hypothetical protein